MEQDGSDPVEVAREFLLAHGESRRSAARSLTAAIATQVPAMAKATTATPEQGQAALHPQLGDQQLGDPGQGDGQAGDSHDGADHDEAAAELDRLDVLLQLHGRQAGLELRQGQEVLAEFGDIGDHLAGAGAPLPVELRGAVPPGDGKVPSRPDAEAGPLIFIVA